MGICLIICLVISLELYRTGNQADFGDMGVTQINLHHSLSATNELVRRFEIGDFDVALMQVPYIKNKSVNLLVKRGKNNTEL